MPFTVTMPKLSPTMEQGTIVKWHFKEGDSVKDGDVLFEVATDKATVEYNTLDGGILRKILVAENQNANVNQAVAIFTKTADESIEGYELELTPPASEPTEEKEQVIEKPEVPQTRSTMAQPAFQPPPPIENYTFDWPLEPTDKILASPAAKKLAKEKGVDLTALKGSGPNGRIVTKDVEYAEGGKYVAFGSKQKPKFAPGSFESEDLSQMRKVIAERLQASKTFIPHFYVQQEVNARALVELREQLKDTAMKLTFNDFVMRACAIALRNHPEINSGFNSKDHKITRYKTVDIAVAVSIDEGLITPIVRYADFKSVAQLSLEVKELVKKAKAGKLQPEEYSGGSFTISNLGMYGVRDFQAVINPPQAAILAVGGILDKPVVENGQVVAGKTMQLSLSVDHRVIDGAVAAEFIRELKELLEKPASLIV